MNHVDKVVAQWRRERPELDVSPMAMIARVNRLSIILGREMERVFAEFGLNIASFDVLATLRRSGAPHRLTPKALMETMMVTSGTMTNRIDQLVKAGLVSRDKNPDDGRGFLVGLTPEGLDVINRAIERHVENQHRIVSGLDPADRDQLGALCQGMLDRFEDDISLPD